MLELMSRGDKRRRTAQATAAAAGQPLTLLPETEEFKLMERWASTGRVRAARDSILRGQGLSVWLPDYPSAGAPEMVFAFLAADRTPAWEDLQAVVTGNDFDNAHTDSTLLGEPGDLLQALTVVLCTPDVQGKLEPLFEANAAQLGQWACRGRTPAPLPPARDGIVVPETAEQLAALALDMKLRPDWHEPDESDIDGRFVGSQLHGDDDPLFLELADVAHADDGTRTMVPRARVLIRDLLRWSAGNGEADLRRVLPEVVQQLFPDVSGEVNFGGVRCQLRGGLLHCEDGPALRDANGSQYWINGEQVSAEMMRELFPDFGAPPSPSAINAWPTLGS